MVDVSCPTAGSCEATVSYGLDENYDVYQCKVTWTPSFTGEAKVACILYGSSNNKLASGDDTVSVTSGSQTTTTITFSPSVDPKDIYKVEVVIMEV